MTNFPPAHQSNVTGALVATFEKIPAAPAEDFTRPVFAAGAVLWRRNQHGDVEYACIHRPHYDDWSLAKGKVDPGESLPATAAREILEETGFHVRLTKLLPKVTYPMGGKTKVVYYWLAEVIGGSFIANSEVDTISWLGFDAAVATLSYTLDHTTLRAADAQIQRGETSRIVLVRQTGKESQATLTKATQLARMLAPFHPQSVHSLSEHACVATATPLAQWLGIKVATFGIAVEDLPQADFAQLIRSLTDVPGTHVVVARGKLIRTFLQQLCPALADAGVIEVFKGSCWLLGFNNRQLVGIDYVASAAAVLAAKNTVSQ
ncbi:NUDIX hydrolase [Corynebacterium felinum]|uniref:8-oxo-dGTP diphosphatase n=1 Tax=Corynebacterium felinum TaxID=131318 RepID=A0ABU2B9Z4_9CORY|nr:NUDIX hydrolase [Corynebacterium felinum]MDF5820420.1 NUDIX hydrolase [Corynebacterium felinum]MDR7355457.1 8-oxo-dGTP diphosphatase [Corynebacterium felinum]WJY94808.1 NUDIX domain protein [Corynebacterium felinum]